MIRFLQKGHFVWLIPILVSAAHSDDCVQMLNGASCSQIGHDAPVYQMCCLTGSKPSTISKVSCVRAGGGSRGLSAPAPPPPSSETAQGMTVGTVKCFADGSVVYLGKLCNKDLDKLNSPDGTFSGVDLTQLTSSISSGSVQLYSDQGCSNPVVPNPFATSSPAKAMADLTSDATGTQVPGQPPVGGYGVTPKQPPVTKPAGPAGPAATAN